MAVRRQGSIRLGADVGGTFTDVVVQHHDGTVRVRKVLSTPPRYELAVLDVLADLLAQPDMQAESITAVIHGTTVATNTVLEQRGSRTALITTGGFRDVLELRRLRMPHMYDLFWRKPPPIVPRELRFELSERVAADGTVRRPLDEHELRRVLEELMAAGVESVAVCLLHSHRHPTHEQRVASFLREHAPRISVSASVEILREEGEYERSATTAINAYVRPVMEAYVDRLDRGIAEAGVSAPLTIMRSSGGVMNAADAAIRPVFALESGPAAGVVAAAGLAEQLDQPNVIAFDMGGTTAKASLIEQGQVSRAREYEVGASLSSGSRLIRGSGELIRIPTLDIAEVGAGGGSIAWLDVADGLHVGPRSAGADPGPACYGQGGTAATVTDANVVLGYMRTGAVADGQIELDPELAEQALVDLAARLGRRAVEAAAGVHQLANARMMRALRAVSSERGREPSDFALVAYGGAGPLHAAGLARELGIRTVIVPAMAGVFSATGLLLAQREFHDVRSCRVSCDAPDAPAVIGRLFAEMAGSAKTAHGSDGVRLVPSLDMRYAGQSWDLELPLEESDNWLRPDAGLIGVAVGAFEAEHERVYGMRYDEGAGIEVRAVRLAAVYRTSTVPVLAPATPEAVPMGAHRETWFEGEAHLVDVRPRGEVPARAIDGPLLIDEYDTTVVVPPDWSVRREPIRDCLVLERHP